MSVRSLLFSALTFLAVGSVLSLEASPLSAQTLTGTWEIAAEGRRGPQTMALELVQEGNVLTGTLTMTMGGPRGGGGGGGGGGPAGRGGSRTVELTDGTVDGKAFSFTITLEMGGNSISQIYSGTFEADEMRGTVEGGRGGGREFTGSRGG